MTTLATAHTHRHRQPAAVVTAALLTLLLALTTIGVASGLTELSAGTRVRDSTPIPAAVVGSIDAMTPTNTGDIGVFGYDNTAASTVATKGLDEAFQAPRISVNRHGQLTNGRYTLDSVGNAAHQTGNLGSGRSQFFSWVDSDSAVLDAAAYADEAGLWVNNKAKVFVENGHVGALATNGEPTQWINLYRTNTGFVHGSPGSPP